MGTYNLIFGASIVALISGWALTLFVAMERANRRMRDAVAKEIELREAAEGSNRATVEFLTGMSQEIRTPMNAIVGFTDLALRTQLNPDLREYLETVRTSAQWLMHVVNDALEFSRGETGRLPLEDTTFSFADCIHSAIRTIEPEAIAKGLGLNCKLDTQIPRVLRGDPSRLRQVVFTLLENAVKHTTSGGVSLTAVLESKSAEAILVRLAFEPLLAENQTSANRVEGALGFAIARKLVRSLGGTFETKNKLGAGTTVEFTAWFRKAKRLAGEGAQGFPHTPKSSRLLSILIAEDNALSRRLATKLLESAGHRVSEAANGRDAVELCSKEFFDLVLMDVEMPEADGFQATQRIRDGKSLNSHVPIYALTAHALSGDREKCLASGMDGYIAKPIEIDAVLKIVGEIASRQPKPEPVSAA
ncbi:MAG TPA: response regulator [Bryobacteraceae bacterium]